MNDKSDLDGEMSPSEALYAFVGWLTTREKTLVIGHKSDCAPVAELVGQFCDLNGLEPPRDEWPQIKLPGEKESA